jgi:hypothetical protein
MSEILGSGRSPAGPRTAIAGSEAAEPPVQQTVRCCDIGDSQSEWFSKCQILTSTRPETNARQTQPHDTPGVGFLLRCCSDLFSAPVSLRFCSDAVASKLQSRLTDTKNPSPALNRRLSDQALKPSNRPPIFWLGILRVLRPWWLLRAKSRGFGFDEQAGFGQSRGRRHRLGA